MHTDRNTLFEKLWHNYQGVTPSAAQIHRILGAEEGHTIINDHIALRTFNLAPVGLDALAEHFLALGYREGGEYHFKGKKLYARHYEHDDPDAPRVFISELLTEQCSAALQQTVQKLVAEVKPEQVKADNFLYSGRHWDLDYTTYLNLLEESEYAAWLAAWGYRANHFTVSVNHLQNYKTVAEINQLLKDNGFTVNASGGEVKGSPEDLLEQSSTMADRVPVQFSDRTMAIPSCFYEFALRYPKPDGSLYNGFVAASADKIFESTHAGM
ncbi:DUF1338 domain-containing protein [Streptosporangium jomthongense]|uniref:2-oxoadipate dioxygenase/decarboxylase n=1 Tax=Marinobacter aromaticivorans TaxID=1494078 RepID=A0ABW2IRK3_9GAMM|nr:DUF1338 domain-containing protein [Marinobacter aromaticivorans]GGE55887.1 DUF1338 domain-containing protein [Streptosporangium jomthongense]